ncbi:hypothetical protein OG806_24705 [Streptomyces sp. NBC_00882]|uniref:hypothetical protein n=1 Tax=Streptomyces sp. NBC_00882 TaxID=2975856 RepID=UPI00386EAA83|nr:hypothetical protein OG806_24705 [Streptomyces sp. NBC_00882]
MDDQRVIVLALEYQSLRSDLVMRSAARFHFLGFVTASAAILATGLGSWHLSLVSLGATLFVIGLTIFWLQGREQAAISTKIAEIEKRINDLVPADPNLLSWETAHQERSFFDYWILGLRRGNRK